MEMSKFHCSFLYLLIFVRFIKNNLTFFYMEITKIYVFLMEMSNFWSFLYFLSCKFL